MKRLYRGWVELQILLAFGSSSVATFSVPFLGILFYGITLTIGAIILGSVGVFTIGLYDDLSHLSARFKLIADF